VPGRRLDYFSSFFFTTHTKNEKQLCDRSEPKEKKKLPIHWDYENYIIDDEKKYTHTPKKGQSLICEGTDGMANKSFLP